MTSPDTSTASAPASPVVAERQPTTPDAEPTAGEQAPDVGPASIHQPGAAPGQFILDGPAEMTVAGRKSKGKSGRKASSSK